MSLLVQLAVVATLIVGIKGNALNFSEMTNDFVYRTGDSSSSWNNQDMYGASVDLISGIYSFRNLHYLVFINSSFDVFTLGIVMNIDPSSNKDPSKVVWEANRDDPVGLNASLTVGRDGNLALRDSDGRLVWSTGTANKGAAKIDIETTGNMVVYRENGERLWQSFDHPSDTLMAGQVFRPGMKLISRVSNSNSSLGRFSLVMEPGGLVLYSASESGSGEPEPYWVRGYYGLDDLSSARHTCEFLSSAVLYPGLVQLLLIFNATNAPAAANVRSSALCGLNATSELQLKEGNEREFNQSFMRLEADGNLRAYSLGERGVWDTSFELLPVCSLPEKCKPFGICTDGQCVECLASDGTKTGWSDECSGPLVESCREPSSIDFIELQGVEHFSSRYLSVPRPSTLEECRNQCLQNCSCSAFFFWNESGSCFQTDRVTTLKTVSNQTHLAQIKTTRVKPSGSGSGSGLSKASIAGIVCAILVVTLVAGSTIVFCIRKRRAGALDAAEYDSDTFLDSLQELRPIRFSYTDLQKITRDFSVKLGAGGFGGVYEGELPGKKVAVKKLEACSGQGKKEFYAEVAVLGTLHHRNLVRLLGFCSDGFHRLLVYEYMPNGSLDKWIFHDKKSTHAVLAWKTRMDIVLGMARGLAYLHEECKQKIIHLDIKPQNVLLDESFVAKVADFGLSRLMAREESFVVTTMRGTPGYLAPEWLLEAAITEKSDVYSFGVVLLEVISGRKNFTRVSDTDKFYLPAWAFELVKEGRDMELIDPRVSEVDEAHAKRVIRLAFLCIQEDGSDRPSMGKVVQMLEGSWEVPQVPLHQSLMSAMRSKAKLADIVTSASSSTGPSSSSVSSHWNEYSDSSLLHPR